MDIQKLFNEHNSCLVCPLYGDGEAKHSHNADRPFKSASIIKIYILAYYLSAGADLEREIELDKSMLIGTSIMTELKLRRATVRELLIYMMSFSDNSATNALILDASMEAINSFCKNVLGTKNTVLGRKMLDYAAVERGEDNLTSLNDCLLAMRLIVSHPVGRDIAGRHKSLERIMRYIFAADLEYYGKSGSIPEVYNDIAVIKRGESDYVFAGVLSYGDDSARLKRLMGGTGLAALDAERPVI